MKKIIKKIVEKYERKYENVKNKFRQFEGRFYNFEKKIVK